VGAAKRRKETCQDLGVHAAKHSGSSNLTGTSGTHSILCKNGQNMAKHIVILTKLIEVHGFGVAWQLVSRVKAGSVSQLFLQLSSTSEILTENGPCPKKVFCNPPVPNLFF
jgi:hypothetical protein